LSRFSRRTPEDRLGWNRGSHDDERHPVSEAPEVQPAREP
jgi:hypothetical protein